MKEIPLSSGGSTIVDDEDYCRFSHKKLWVNHDGYVMTWEDNTNKLLHRIINCTPKGVVTDHINGNRLDNRRSNLKSVSNLENQTNRYRNQNNRSGCSGVWFDPKRRKWKVMTCLLGKQMYMGYYKTYEEAKRVFENSLLVRVLVYRCYYGI